jgi:threonylcarbamoyladenosine tRNA methylthiotransferase MtaB
LRNALKRICISKKNPKTGSQKPAVIVTGCLADANPSLKHEIPGNYLIIKNKDKFKIAKWLGFPATAHPLASSMFKVQCSKFPTPLPQKIRANLMIENGCENFCTYCIVPYVRGKVKSKKISEIICSAKKLVQNGTREIILTGINLGAYGSDLENHPTLVAIIRALSKIKNLKRIRLSSLEPQYVTPALIKEMKNNPKLCRHLHLPLQSGDDQILRDMNRKYTIADFIKLCQAAKIHIKDLAITTDIIVGFPGETAAAFNRSLAAVNTANFSRVHVFSFSLRRQTAAGRLSNQIDPKTIKTRAQKMRSLRDHLMLKFAAQYLNKTVEILAEEYNHKEKTLEGYTSNYLHAKFKGTPNLLGKIVKVKICCPRPLCSTAKKAS